MMEAVEFRGIPMFIVSMILKGVILAGIAILIAIVLRRKSGAFQNDVWKVACAGLLLLPVLGGIDPLWQPWQSSVAMEEPILGPLEVSQIVAVESATVGAEEEELPIVARKTGRKTGFGISWSAIAIGLWGIGTAVVLLRYAGGHWKLRRLEKTCERLDDSRWLCCAEQVRCDLNLKTTPLLLHGGDVVVPFVSGVLKSRLFLPKATVAEASREEREAILYHELTHIQRRDLWWRLIAQVMVAIHWVNPLAWFVVARLKLTEERAVDDAVLSRGVRPVSYAELLARFASGASEIRMVPAMAHASTVEQRVARILDGNQNRRKSGVLVRGIMIAAGLVMLGLLASVGAQEGSDQQVVVDGDDWRTIAFEVDSEKWMQATRKGGRNLSAKEYLESQGIHFPNGGAAIFDQSRVVVRLKLSAISNVHELLAERFPALEKVEKHVHLAVEAFVGGG